MLALGEADLGFVPLHRDQSPLKRPQFEVDVERRLVEVLPVVELEGEVFRSKLHAVVNEGGVPRSQEHPEVRLALHVPERVLRGDPVSVAEIPLDLLQIHELVRGLLDVDEVLVHAHGGPNGVEPRCDRVGRGEEVGLRIREVHHQAGAGEIHGDDLQDVHRVVLPVAEQLAAAHEPVRPVRHGVIELVFADVLLLEEEEVEPGGQAEPGVPLVDPQIRAHDLVPAVELLPRTRLAEDDPEPAPVRLPTRPGGIPPQEPVRVIEPLVVLGPELVLLRRRHGIPPLPERLDEVFAFLESLHPEEHLPFGLGDDVDHLLFEPDAMLLGQAVHALVGSGEGAGKQGEPGGRQRERQAAAAGFHGQRRGFRSAREHEPAPLTSEPTAPSANAATERPRTVARIAAGGRVP